MSGKKISIVIPVLNDAESLQICLATLLEYRTSGCEVIVVDGGSSDNSVDVARQYADRVLVSARGRAQQMNAGASQATGDTMLFLHADTQLPEQAQAVIQTISTSRFRWGFFALSLSGRCRVFRLIERFINMRSIISKIGTGDQAIFFERDFFNRHGGFIELPIMEDVEICKRLRNIESPLVIYNLKVQTSSRRWQQHGVVSTILLMWRLRLLYWLGVNPRSLARQY